MPARACIFWGVTTALVAKMSAIPAASGEKSTTGATLLFSSILALASCSAGYIHI